MLGHWNLRTPNHMTITFACRRVWIDPAARLQQVIVTMVDSVWPEQCELPLELHLLEVLHQPRHPPACLYSQSKIIIWPIGGERLLQEGELLEERRLGPPARCHRAPLPQYLYTDVTAMTPQRIHTGVRNL